MCVPALSQRQSVSCLGHSTLESHLNGVCLLHSASAVKVQTQSAICTDLYVRRRKHLLWIITPTPHRMHVQMQPTMKMHKPEKCV